MKNKFFDGKSFIISLAVGLFFVYITVPDPEIIYVYPNPDNGEKILYKDKSNVCHKMKSQEVKCPIDTNKIREYPGDIDSYLQEQITEIEVVKKKKEKKVDKYKIRKKLESLYFLNPLNTHLKT